VGCADAGQFRSSAVDDRLDVDSRVAIACDAFIWIGLGAEKYLAPRWFTQDDGSDLEGVGRFSGMERSRGRSVEKRTRLGRERVELFLPDPFPIGRAQDETGCEVRKRDRPAQGKFRPQGFDLIGNTHLTPRLQVPAE
jgi:hypothetical protein